MNLSKAKSSTYSIVKLEKTAINNAPKNIWLNGNIVDGINGTCFFIDKNHFVTAHHIFNSNSNSDCYCFLYNDIMIHNDIEIIYENKDLDLTIGVTQTAVKNFLELNQCKVAKNINGIFLGYDKRKTINASLKMKIGDREINCSSLNVHMESIGGTIIDIQNLEEFQSSDNLIKLKNSHVYIVNSEVPVGYSGGPFLTQDLRVLGLQSMLVHILSEDNKKSNTCSLVVDISSEIRNLL